MSAKKLVVIGNGMVGQRLLERLADATSSFEITVLCEEPRPAYDRVQLTSFFSGKSAADLSLDERPRTTPMFPVHHHAFRLTFRSRNLVCLRASL